MARLWLGPRWTDTVDGDVENYPAAARAVPLFRAAHDPVGLSAALWRAASTVLFRDHTPSAAALLQQALLALAGRPASKWQALSLVREADLLMSEGALSAALAKYDQAITTMRTLGYGYGLMVCGGNRGYALFELGQHDEAIAALRGLASELPPGLRHPVLSLLATMLAATVRFGRAHPGARGTGWHGHDRHDLDPGALDRGTSAVGCACGELHIGRPAARLCIGTSSPRPDAAGPTPDGVRRTPNPSGEVAPGGRTRSVAGRGHIVAETEAMAAAMSASETAGT